MDWELCVTEDPGHLPPLPSTCFLKPEQEVPDPLALCLTCRYIYLLLHLNFRPHQHAPKWSLLGQLISDPWVICGSLTAGTDWDSCCSQKGTKKNNSPINHSQHNQGLRIILQMQVPVKLEVADQSHLRLYLCVCAHTHMHTHIYADMYRDPI